MIVTIDGPAGAGKSLVARMLAERLGFRFLDTGAMYRAAALAALRRNVDWNDESAVAAVVAAAKIESLPDRVLLDGEDVTQAIRTVEITKLTRHTANNPQVRRHLVALQRHVVAAGNYVTEGRDQGTVAFPNAECKIFLVASPEERARRRHRDLVARGETIALEEVLAQQTERDQSDSARAAGPLIAAPDAVEVNTDGLTPEQVVDKLVSVARNKT
ncbi:MAG: (d)CMP kinase [Planctomycetota bacterium]|nr:MAG: (d)CMP kinase [Planctomycetota bacterium]